MYLGKIFERHVKITHAIDILTINKILFIMTTSRNIHVCTLEPIWDKKIHNHDIHCKSFVIIPCQGFHVFNILVMVV